MKPDWTARTDDGLTLGVKVTEPTGPARADILLLHAMMVDARVLDRPVGAGLASTLAGQGFRVHRADLRGRGMSDRPTDFSYDDLVYRDLPALIAGIGGTPWVVGHSLGGHVGIAAWASGSVALAGLVGLGANVWRPSFERSLRMRAAKAGAMAAAALSVGLYGGLAARRVKLGPVDEPRSYALDLVRFWTSDRWADRSGRDWSADARRLEGPILQVFSRGDRLLAHVDGARAWAAGLGSGCEIWEISDGEHGMARAPDHMQLGCDGASAGLWAAAGAWIQGKIDASRGSAPGGRAVSEG